MIKIDDFYRLATLWLLAGCLAVVPARAQPPDRDSLSAPADTVVAEDTDKIGPEPLFELRFGSLASLSDQDQYETTRNPGWDRDQRRWEKFEAEYGIKRPHPSPFLANLETAKYRLDKTLFSVDDLVESLESAFEFEYSFRSGRWMGRDDTRSASRTVVRETYRSSPWNLLEDARLKSEIDLDVFRSEAFIGLRLVIPIGD